MLFKTSQWLFKRLILKKIVIESKSITRKKLLFEDSCVISSPSAWSFFLSHFEVNPSQIILDQSIELEKINQSAKDILENRIIGIGGGRVLDAAKVLAKIGKKQCILIPTILSTTAWLNPGSSLKQGSHVYHSSGKFDEVLIDPEFIASAPHNLNIGGIADILCGYNSLSDWILAQKKKGKNMPKNALKLILGLCNNLLNEFESHLPITADSIHFIANNFIKALSLCWGFQSGRPVEGSEHFLYYALEESFNKPMNHGSIIALNTLVCLRLRGKDALIDSVKLIDFFNRIGISYTLSALDIPIEIYKSTLESMPEFVKIHRLKFSIWDTIKKIDQNSIADLLI